MGALRERYFARHGVGHANRSWFDDAVCVDTQSRGVRFPIARRRGIANSNPDSNSNSYSYCNGNSYAYCYSYTCSKTDADSKASPDAKTASIKRTSESAVYDRRRRHVCRN
jgi:hypothetical protein